MELRLNISLNVFIQGGSIVIPLIKGNNFTNVELNGRVHTSVFIDGAVVFKDRRPECPMELRRYKGMDFATNISVIKGEIQNISSRNIKAERYVLTTRKNKMMFKLECVWNGSLCRNWKITRDTPVRLKL